MTARPTVTPDTIRALLRRRRLTQADLAAALTPPVTQSTVSRWLSGDLTPADDHAAQIAGLALGPGPDAPPASLAEIAASWQALIDDNAGDDAPLARNMVRLARATLAALGADPA